jgi:hypothetical protein
MMITLMLSVAICTLALLMLGHAYVRACRNYIEQRQTSAGMLPPAGTRS